MALIIEDGTGKTDSNSYSTVAELDAYAALRGITLSGTEADKEVLLIKAMDYLESFGEQYKGIITFETQALLWPRYGAVINTYQVDSDEIPKELKKAQLVAATIINSGGELLPSVSPKVIKEQVDVISVTYSDKGGSNNTQYPELTRAMSPLLGSGSGLNFKVGRA